MKGVINVHAQREIERETVRKTHATRLSFKSHQNIAILKLQKLTPWLWFSPTALNSNSSTLPTLLAILLPVSPAPAAGGKRC